MDTRPLGTEIDGAVELDDIAMTIVEGPDARAWLNDLVTTDVASLAPGEQRPSLLLTPTGRIRAVFWVGCLSVDRFALAERRGPERPIDVLLAPYLLSSEVRLEPAETRRVALLGDSAASAASAGELATLVPSVLGGGADVLVRDASELVARLGRDGVERVAPSAVERRRIRRGSPRFGVDLDAGALPAEAALDVAPVTDRAKGCFLGQEAVAKIANLGHPPRLLVRVEGSADVGAGEPVFADGVEVGVVTSAEGRAGLARVAWDARSSALTSVSGGGLEPGAPAPEPL